MLNYHQYRVTVNGHPASYFSTSRETIGLHSKTTGTLNIRIMYKTPLVFTIAWLISLLTTLFLLGYLIYKIIQRQRLNTIFS